MQCGVVKESSKSPTWMDTVLGSLNIFWRRLNKT